MGNSKHSLNTYKIKQDKSTSIYYYNIIGKKEKQELAGQDNTSIIELENFSYIGIYDGHGEKGKEASIYLKNHLERYIKKNYKIIQNISVNNPLNNNFINYINKENIKEDSNTNYLNQNKLKKLFTNEYKCIQNYFKKYKYDYKLSGTCSLCAIYNHINSVLYCINLGDSRCVLGSIKNNKKIAFELSSDHKPNRENESRRISNLNGKVASKGGGVSRVYKINSDEPGLAVSRSLGDLLGHDCGVVYEPEVIAKEINVDDYFVVIASDGVWDIMSSNEVIGFIFNKMFENKDSNKDTIVKSLVEECRLRWELLNLYKEKYINENIQIKIDLETKNEIDDISAIILFF